MTDVGEPAPQHTRQRAPLWQQAFRPFFLTGALFAVIAMALWLATWYGYADFSPYGNSLFWHAHEMLFGFVAAIITGFLLTAVQNWTGLRAINGLPLVTLFCLWLLGRLAMALGPAQHGWIIALIDVSFLPAVAAYLAQLVIRAKNYRNLVFVPVLLLLTCANLLMHLSQLTERPESLRWGIYAGCMLVCVLMVVIGGRVIPMFTANGTQTPRAAPLPWLEKTALTSTWLCALLAITNLLYALPPASSAALFGMAGVANAYRLFRWKPWVTLGTPLVWSLHLAYGFIPAGFIAFALHFAGMGVTASTALHTLTAGAMGSLILAMIARVSLGHSGRPLAPAGTMSLAFALIVIAGVLRVLAGQYPTLLSGNVILLSGASWIIAYAIYIFCYTPILLAPRPDGKPG